MSWILLSVFSAFLLGIYDAAKKASVRENAVPPVLFLAVVCGAAIWVPILVFGKAFPDWLPTDRLRVQSISTGITIVMAAFYAFSIAGRKEGSSD